MAQLSNNSWWHLPLREREDGWKQLDIDIFQTQWCQRHETFFLPELLQVTQERTLTLVLHAHLCLSSVQFSHSVVSNSLWPPGLQHARPPCSSPTPRVYLNSCPLSRWCHPAILSSVIPFSSCPQSLPASGLFKWVSSFNEYSGLISFRMDWSDLLAVQGTLKRLLQQCIQETLKKWVIRNSCKIFQQIEKKGILDKSS